MGLNKARSNQYLVFFLIIVAIGSVIIFSSFDSTFAAKKKWQEITEVDSEESDNTTELSIETSEEIPPLDELKYAGFGWFYKDGPDSAYIISTQFRPGGNNLEAHNITLERAKFSASINYCATNISDSGFENIEIDGEVQRLRGEGNGPISAMLDALQLPIDVVNYEERSISSGANAKALALIELQVKGTGKSAFGAGIHDNIVTSSIEAIIACTNRLIEQGVLTTEQVAAAAV